jgi:NAD(P)-dependent dehydrogenase (short-subunit alcohol dehydrogenase family)
MLGLVWGVLVPIAMSALMMFLNVLSYGIRKLFHSGKAVLNPRCLVVVVTGCDTGFGEMAAIRLSKQGFQVVAGCLTEEGAARLKGSVAAAVVCDITKEGDVARLAAEAGALVETLNGHLWALVNNAGIANSGPLDWVPLDSYRRVMEVNFFGHVSVTKALLPLLKQCGEARIINLSSVAGIVGGANLSAYSASKHAMEGFMKSLVPELRPWHIYVCNINPAFMRTPMIADSVEKGMAAFGKAPKELQSQYNDPRPQLSEGERLVNDSVEDPLLVVHDIQAAVTDARPEMWYFPGRAASVFRFLSLATSDTNKYFISRISEGTVHTPTPEILRKRKPKTH